jgi:hypothetical protein
VRFSCGSFHAAAGFKDEVFNSINFGLPDNVGAALRAVSRKRRPFYLGPSLPEEDQFEGRAGALTLRA